MVLKRHAVPIVRARFDGYADRGSSGEALFRIHAIRDHVHRFDRFNRRNVCRVLRQPYMSVASPIDACIIRALRRTVHLRNEPLLGIRNDRILWPRRAKARYKFQQRLVVTPARNR